MSSESASALVSLISAAVVINSRAETIGKKCGIFLAFVFGPCLINVHTSAIVHVSGTSSGRHSS